MKHLIVVLFLMQVHILTAQSTGEITYETTIDIHRRMTGDRAQFKEMVPPTRTFKTQLIYNESESYYKTIKNEAITENQSPRSRGPRGRMMSMQENNLVYTNYSTEERVEQREFLDKKFLITGAPESFAWKITGETKQVGDFLCTMATHSDTSQTIIAWFTTQIPVPLGPARFGQLPGLILHVDINEGERTYTAVDLNFREVGADEIEKPTKGKQVTDEEFRTLVHEKMLQQREQGGMIRMRGPGRN